MEATQTWIGNKAILNAKLRKEAWYNTFWAKYAGFVDVSRDDNGNPRYAPSGKPIEMLRDFVQQGRDNMQIPFLRYLTGDPVHGDTVLKGTGEDMTLWWLMTYLNQTRKAVMKRSGKMSEQREKIYKLYEEAKPLLVDWFSKYENFNVMKAFYEGVSWELSRGTNYDGLGLAKRLHPNWYYISSATAIAAVGTEYYTKTSAQMDTAVAALSTFEWAYAHLRQARLKCMQLKIPQIVTKNGYKFWAMLMHPGAVNKLKTDANYLAAVRAAYNGKMMEEPELQGAVSFIEGFAIFEDIALVRAWDADASPYSMFGTTFATAIEPSTVLDNSNTLIFGNQAVGKAIAADEQLRFTEEIDDHENTIEIGGAVMSGYNRADHFAEGDAGESSGDAFYKAQTTEHLCSALLAKNQSSMVIMSDDR
jgi:hypothetical protein